MQSGSCPKVINDISLSNTQNVANDNSQTATEGSTNLCAYAFCDRELEINLMILKLEGDIDILEIKGQGHMLNFRPLRALL